MVHISRKAVLVIILTVLVIVGAAVSSRLLSKKADIKPSPETPAFKSRSSESNFIENKSPENTAAVDRSACDIFSLEDAKKILGPNVKNEVSDTIMPKNSEHIVISTCSYSSEPNAGSSSRTASLLVRKALNAEGSANDKAQFGPNKPSTAQDIFGYGEAAYWNSDFRELNILKGDVWYIITAGSTVATERKLEDALNIANLIKSKQIF